MLFFHCRAARGFSVAPVARQLCTEKLVGSCQRRAGGPPSSRGMLQQRRVDKSMSHPLVEEDLVLFPEPLQRRSKSCHFLQGCGFILGPVMAENLAGDAAQFIRVRKKTVMVDDAGLKFSHSRQGQQSKPAAEAKTDHAESALGADPGKFSQI